MGGGPADQAPFRRNLSQAKPQDSDELPPALVNPEATPAAQDTSPLPPALAAPALDLHAHPNMQNVAQSGTIGAGTAESSDGAGAGAGSQSQPAIDSTHPTSLVDTREPVWPAPIAHAPVSHSPADAQTPHQHSLHEVTGATGLVTLGVSTAAGASSEGHLGQLGGGATHPGADRWPTPAHALVPAPAPSLLSAPAPAPVPSVVPAPAPAPVSVPAAPAPGRASHATMEDPLFLVRRIEFRAQGVTRSCPVIMQNSNGPCPLLAVLNVLLLRGEVQLYDVTRVPLSTLLQLLSEYALSRPASGPQHQQAAFAAGLGAVLDLLPTVAQGLDVNLQFKGVDKFEFTSSISMFDLFDITLLHGWLPDPQEKVAKFLSGLSYNEALTLPLTGTASSAAASAVHEWLNENPSQLTITGLFELHKFVQEGQLCVLLRNNHFQAIIKHDRNLFALVTDEGFASTQIAWETLVPDGDTEYVTAAFVPPAHNQVYQQPASSSPASSAGYYGSTQPAHFQSAQNYTLGYPNDQYGATSAHDYPYDPSLHAPYDQSHHPSYNTHPHHNNTQPSAFAQSAPTHSYPEPNYTPSPQHPDHTQWGASAATQVPPEPAQHSMASDMALARELQHQEDAAEMRRRRVLEQEQTQQEQRELLEQERARRMQWEEEQRIARHQAASARAHERSPARSPAERPHVASQAPAEREARDHQARTQRVRQPSRTETRVTSEAGCWLL